MKKLFTILVTCTLLSTAYAAQPTSPLVVTPSSTAITVDADEKDWSGVTTWNNIAVVFKDEESGFSGAADLTGKFKVTFDAARIYFFFKITDDVVTQSPVQPGEHWIGDKVEIYFGLPGYDPTKQANALHARQFAIKAQFDPTPLGQCGSQNYAPASDKLDTDGVEYAYDETADGYLLEVSIDRAIALENVPNNIDFGFDIGINDNDEIGVPGKRYRKCWYNDGAINELWANMSGAGKIRLNGPSGVAVVQNDFQVNIQNSKITADLNTDFDIRIYDITGKDVMSASSVRIVDISDLSKGVYIAKLNTVNGKKAIYRFIK
jgi:hypothetical protein